MFDCKIVLAVRQIERKFFVITKQY